MMREDVGTIATTVRGRCQIAHSFRGKLEIPLHGITYVVDATFAARGDELAIPLTDADALLSSVLGRYDRTNLDCNAEFADENTTCERVARAVWEGLVASASPHEWAAALAHLLVRVRESDEAFVEYGRAVGAAGGPPEAAAGEYAVAVRARCMVGRALDFPPGGSGRTCEGSTLVVDAVFCGSALDPEAGFLFDICLGERLLRQVVEPLHQRHLRDLSYPQLHAHDSASVARVICVNLGHKLAAEKAAGALARLRVVVRESDVLAAEAECALPMAALAGAEWEGRCALCLEGSGGAGHPQASWPIPRAAIRIESSGLAGGSAYCARAAFALRDALAAHTGLAPGRDFGFSAPQPHQPGPPEIDPPGPISGFRADAPPDAAPALAALSRRLWSLLCASLGPDAPYGCGGHDTVDADAGSAPRIDRLEVKVRTAGRRSVAFGRATSPSPRPAQILVLDVEAAVEAREEARMLSRVAAATERARVALLPGPMAKAVRAEVEAAGWEDLPVDVSRGAGATPTGLAHHTPLAQLLQSTPARLVAVSSCSCEREARDALASLGLADVPWRHVLTQRALAVTPAALERAASAGAKRPRCDSEDESAGAPPTVYGSALFWFEVASFLSCSSSEMVLIGDSASLAAASAAGVDVRLPPLSPSFPLLSAVLAALHCRSSAPRSAAAYLRAKRLVDERARCQEVVDRLVDALTARRRASRPAGGGGGVRDTAGEGAAVCGPVDDTAGEGVCRVVDVGAGSLSLLPVVTRAVAAAGYSVLRYDAIDSDAAPLADAADALAASTWESLPIAECGEAPGTTAHALPGDPVANLHLPSVQGSVEVWLELRRVDVRALASGRAARGADGTLNLALARPYDLLVASAFADLMSPQALLSTLVRLAPAAVAYLPITFCGRTELVPPSAGAAAVPSDARVSAAYHDHLRAQGQHFDLPALFDACDEAGAARLAVGPSNWSIGPSDAFFPYMLDFVSAGTALPLWREGFCPATWRDSVVARGASLCVGNVDLLLALPAAPRAASRPRRALQFSAPRAVNVVVGPAAAGPHLLGAGQVLLRSLISMVSSGTELLVYRGQLDASDQPLDASIPGMDAAPPAYPMEYGYSLVATVAAVGAQVPLSLVGQTVFAFAPHASEGIVDVGCVQRIPPDLASSPADAAFLPAAETAISISHDAHPRLGETAAVFGAGVIGLFTASALIAAGATVSVFDPRADRLPVALALGARHAAPPSEAAAAAFDVTVECSGNPAALQAAVDATADGGRVVVASWYGSKPVCLELGTRFHRSHMQLIASQVSHIPAAHGYTWTKHRRFGAAWQLIRRVRPARTIPLRTVPLEGAAAAYAALDAGEAIACHLTYDDAGGE